jgi:AraC-like DNA-binding protein
MTKEEIVSVLKDLNKITGYRVSLHGADYSEIAAYPKEKCGLCRLIQSLPFEYDKCVASDKLACKSALDKKGTHIYRCRYGMSEAISPLYNFGTLTGFLMMGQVFEEGIDKDCLLAPVVAGVGEERVMAAIGTIPTVAPENIAAYIKIMTICAQYLTLSNALPSEKPSVGELVKRYIHENFTEKIGIADMCREIGCSKTTLIASFKREFGTTVNKYLTSVRLSEALSMLRSGKMSVGEVALAAGFSDQSYFSKVFSSEYGVPPSEFRAVKEPPEVRDFN